MHDERLDPSPARAHYIHLRALAATLRASLAAWSATRGDAPLAVVDIGCGDKPYEPLFEGRTREYVGVDVFDGPRVDVVAPMEDLPLEDGRFDCVICTQAIQYTTDPRQAIAEMARVLAPGGLALVSTHGMASSVIDRWRWTQQGLFVLFDESGWWSELRVVPHGGVASALAYLAGTQLEGLATAAGRPRAVAPLVFGANALAWSVDRAYRRALPGRDPDFAPSFLVSAVRRPGVEPLS
jgi:SAM-dependent methyltransferase